ncbi:ATP-binding protein [Acetobacterium sp.]|uniref:ATP-binding protein n=1 Tax=Acetobacterium sp. TaxID=1872094 RepID=UPI002F410E71
MKTLRKLLLIHWHYFNHELIEFGQLNFLTGKNASGKSTIIDALQLILLGDTSGNFFNKAASGRGNRTLKGYLMGELGDDEDSGFRYIRSGGRFTSYIVLEFYDTEKKRAFTVGCCFDIHSENDIQKRFFLYDGEMHHNGFLNGNTPMDITALRSYLKECYAGHYETTDIGRDFRTKLYGKLGGLRDRFAGILKKAVSFNPNVDIQQFISDFVCDTQQAVDVSYMQENIRSYKRLEAEADVLKERILLLESIVDAHQRYISQRDNEQLYSYLIDRACADMKRIELDLNLSSEKSVSEQLDVLNKEITEEDFRLIKLREQRDTLNAQLLNDSTAQALDTIDRQITEKECQIQTLRTEFDKALAILASHISTWRKYTEAMLQKIGSIEISLLQSGIASRISDICMEGRDFLNGSESLLNVDIDTVLNVGKSGLIEFSTNSDNLKRHSIELASHLREEQDDLARLRSVLLVEQQSLEVGIYRFPQDALDLKKALISRLRTVAKLDVNVRIVAETAEIKSDRWRNVIEGYLNTQKFYIIVPQEYFKEALKVYDTIKRQQAIYGTGIVDIEKLKRLNPTANMGSLAEEIETDDLDVKVFLYYTLGRVQKCDNVSELRRFQTSVTDEGMLYQNFVVRAMNPDRWKKPAIGQSAIQRRLESVKEEIAFLTEQVAVCAGIKIGLDYISALTLLSNTEIERIVLAADNFSFIPTIESDLTTLRKSREAIDTSAIDSLKNRITTLDENISELDNLLRQYSENRGKFEETLRHLKEETIPKLTEEQEKKESNIVTGYSDEWIREISYPRYIQELFSRGKPDNIADAFPRERSRTKNAKEQAWEQTTEFRRKYNEKYKMGLDIKAESNGVYDDAWLELTDNKLSDYLARITDARSKAFEQFQEDFLSRLQNNINNAKRQIDELNVALKGASFGEDTYRFRIIPKSEYKRYYDMIVDEMLLQGGYNLLSGQFNAKYKDEIADLFAIITNEDGTGGSKGSVEYEKRVHEFTDYRTYLDFDLEVVGNDGVSQRLSRTLGKKSGGETQTPFYIAVLASFAQLYRVGREKSYKTSRLIIFDEAFSKMDGERIVRSIELLRKFEFQVILSAPPDKMGDIATLVDKNLCVLRNGEHTCVRSFDPKQIEGIINE